MIYKFRVAHSETANPLDQAAQCRALSASQLLKAYTDTGVAFEKFFASLPLFGASFKVAEPTMDGLDITLDTQLDALSVRNIVSSFMRDMNQSTPGLQLIATRS